jgi:hypothetical protein
MIEARSASVSTWCADPDDQHDPPFKGFRIVLVDLEGDLVLSVRDTGPQVLFGEGVGEGVGRCQGLPGKCRTAQPWQG